MSSQVSRMEMKTKLIALHYELTKKKKKKKM